MILRSVLNTDNLLNVQNFNDEITKSISSNHLFEQRMKTVSRKPRKDYRE